MSSDQIRNIAIIAHVDHGKTTLVDAMLRQSGIFRSNEEVTERVMDSNDLERERGITILAKTTGIRYHGVKINIVDTPGHSDFGGEVERALKIVDGVLLLVDASEGPLPQTRYVLMKALEARLPVVAVINKIDRPDARVQEVQNELFDLFIDLDATEAQLDFPTVFSNARAGLAKNTLEEESDTLQPLFEAIVKYIPHPKGEPTEVLQFLVANLDYSEYLGRLAIGRVFNGTLRLGEEVAIMKLDGSMQKTKITKLYSFEGLKRVDETTGIPGDILAIAGVEGISIGETITSAENPKALAKIQIDEPTIAIIFTINTSPFAGREGQFVTFAQSTRAARQGTADERFDSRGTGRRAGIVPRHGTRGIATRHPDRDDASRGIRVDGRQAGDSLERNRRSHSRAIGNADRRLPGDVHGRRDREAWPRKGKIKKMVNHGSGRVRLEFDIPTRGLIGLRSAILTDTRGTAILNTLFNGYTPWQGDIATRPQGSLVADRAGKATSFAIWNLQERGEILISPGTEVYEGMIIGENARDQDMDVNIVKEKKLTNMRSSTADEAIRLVSPRMLNLEQAIEFIRDDELVEITPKSIRLRKKILAQNKR
jgi:GTP-binding protein